MGQDLKINITGRNLAPMGLMFLGDLHPVMEICFLLKAPTNIESGKVED